MAALDGVLGWKHCRQTGRVYQCTGAGISAGGGVYTGGDGPHGTGASFTDNTVTWSYVSDAPLWPNIINGGNMGHSSYDALNEIPGYLSSGHPVFREPDGPTTSATRRFRTSSRT